MNDKDLIIQGIEWLVKNIQYRDEQMKTSGGLAEQYAGRQLRVLSRIRHYISESKEHNDEFHNLIMNIGKTLPNDFFQMFFIMYSQQARVFDPAIDSEFNQTKTGWIKA